MYAVTQNLKKLQKSRCKENKYFLLTVTEKHILSSKAYTINIYIPPSIYKLKVKTPKYCTLFRPIEKIEKFIRIVVIK